MEKEKINCLDIINKIVVECAIYEGCICALEVVPYGSMVYIKGCTNNVDIIKISSAFEITMCPSNLMVPSMEPCSPVYFNILSVLEKLYNISSSTVKNVTIEGDVLEVTTIKIKENNI